jgi:uncharacterized protein (TIGR02466 family)
MNKLLHSLFPTHIFETQLDFNNSEVIDCIKSLEFGIQRSIRNGKQTDKNLHLQYNVFSKINSDIHLFLNSCINEVLIPIEENHAHKIKYETKEMWANISEYQGYNIEHNHPGYFMSGVFYVNVSQNSGNIVFRDPRPIPDWSGDASLYKLLYANTSITPKNNMLLLFPSWLYHRVETNYSDTERISVSFNIHKYI